MSSVTYYAPRAMALGLVATVGFALWWNQGAPWAQEPALPAEAGALPALDAGGKSAPSDPGAVALSASSDLPEGGAPWSSPLGDAALDVGGPVGAAAFAGMLASRMLRREREWAVPLAAWVGAATALAIMAPPAGLAAWGAIAIKAGAAALVAIYGHRVTRRRTA